MKGTRELDTPTRLAAGALAGISSVGRNRSRPARMRHDALTSVC